MSRNIHIVDIIQASTGNNPIISKSKQAYATPYELSDFNVDDLITKRAALELSGNIIEVPVISAGTNIPFFIDLSLYAGLNPGSDIITKATSYDPATGDPTGRLQRYYDMPVEDQDTNNDGTGDFTGCNIYGHDDGSGNFKEDTYIIIRV